jgi:glycosyltransferase involved in cell wall biosynthesis
MRIAINGWFWDQSHTGSSQYLRHLVSTLVHIAPEHIYYVVTPDGSYQISTSEPLKTLAATSRTTGLRKVWFEQITFPRAAAKLKADLAHVPYWGSPYSLTVPTLVTIHDIIPLVLPAYRGHALVRTYTGLVQSAAANADMVITDSQASKRDIVTHLDVPEERIRVICLAVGSEFMPGAPDRKADKEIRAQYGLPKEYILYLGNFDVRKNLVGLLQAWTFAEGPLGQYTALAIAGRLPEHSAFTPDPRKIVRTLEIDPQTIDFPGPIEERHKPAVYRGAVCFVWPSRYEGFGLPVLEAMSCGLPVIGIDASSTPEVVGDAGILVSPDDIRGMAGAIIAVVDERPLREHLSDRAVRQAAHFSWEETAQETLKVYQEVKV